MPRFYVLNSDYIAINAIVVDDGSTWSAPPDTYLVPYANGDKSDGGIGWAYDPRTNTWTQPVPVQPVQTGAVDL